MGSIVTGVRQRRAARRRWFVAGAIAILCGGLSFPFARGSLKIPYAGPPQLAPEDAVAVLAGLLHNIYRAFDRREESLVYDRLAQSISGDLLSDVYLQTRRSMQLENQGGAHHAKRRGKTNMPWLATIIDRKPTKVVAVALANRNARIVWALLSNGGTYQKPIPVAAA